MTQSACLSELAENSYLRVIIKNEPEALHSRHRMALSQVGLQ